jgi:hypothetical protein
VSSPDPDCIQIFHQVEQPQDGEVELSVRCLDTCYILEIEAGMLSYSAKVAAEHLTISPPVGGTFAGVMYGVYSFGKGEPVLDPADFTEIVVTRDR